MGPRTADRYLVIIAAFKLIKGLLLLGLAFGALGLLHKDTEAIARHWVGLLHFDPSNRHVAAILAKVGMVDDRKIEELSGLTFIYAAIFLAEGVGLLTRRQWAKYFTIIATAAIIPVEIYALCHHFDVKRAVLLVISIAIVWFLIVLLRKERPSLSYYRPTVLFK